MPNAQFFFKYVYCFMIISTFKSAYIFFQKPAQTKQNIL